jgi:16S rRNA processing protein RimM
VPADPASRATVARVLRARGRVGEVAAELLTDFPERLTRLSEVFLWDGAHEPPRRVRVRRCWFHKGQAIFHFEGCDSINDAERLAGWQVQIPLEDRMTLPPGSYYVTDLMGCEVWEPGIPERLGLVREVDLATGTPLLVVDTSRGELLIPLAVEICRVIDVAKRRIEVVLPEGLRQLND